MIELILGLIVAYFACIVAFAVCGFVCMFIYLLFNG